MKGASLINAWQSVTRSRSNPTRCWIPHLKEFLKGPTSQCSTIIWRQTFESEMIMDDFFSCYATLMSKHPRPSPIGWSGGEPYALKGARTVRRGVHWLEFLPKEHAGYLIGDIWASIKTERRMVSKAICPTNRRKLGSYPTGLVV